MSPTTGPDAATIESLKTFHDELYGEMEKASDRAVVVIAAAGLDILLGLIISSATIEEVTLKKLTDSNAPFATFSNKILACYGLGLISREEFLEANLIRKIRNDFAHSLGASSLSTEPHASRCRDLKLCDRSLAPPRGTVPFVKDPESGLPLRIGSDLQIPEGVEVPRVPVEMTDASDPRQRLMHSTFALFECLQSRWASTECPESPTEFSEGGPRAMLADMLDQSIRKTEEMLKDSDGLGIDVKDGLSESVKNLRYVRDLSRNADAVVRWNRRQGAGTDI